MPQPSNETLAQMIDSLGKIIAKNDLSLREIVKEKFDANDKYHEAHGERLDKLNGQVGRNTSWRLKGTVIFGLAMLVIPTVVTTFVVIAIEKLFA